MYIERIVTYSQGLSVYRGFCMNGCKRFVCVPLTCLLDLMPWRRRCSPLALAAQVAYDAPPLMSILCSSGGFSERQLQSVAILLDVVYPLLPWSSLRSTSGDVSIKECVWVSLRLHTRNVQNMLVSVSEAALLRLRRCPTHS